MVFRRAPVRGGRFELGATLISWVSGLRHAAPLRRRLWNHCTATKARSGLGNRDAGRAAVSFRR